MVVNQMTTKIDNEGQGKLTPALGASWGHAPNFRLMLDWDPSRTFRWAVLVKSSSMPSASTPYQVMYGIFRLHQTLGYTVILLYLSPGHQRWNKGCHNQLITITTTHSYWRRKSFNFIWFRNNCGLILGLIVKIILQNSYAQRYRWFKYIMLWNFEPTTESQTKLYYQGDFLQGLCCIILKCLFKKLFIEGSSSSF